jgi:hypothetical protein
MGARDRTFDGLAIQTRSVAVIMRNVAASVDVPREHIEEGIVNTTAEPSAVLRELGASLSILSSRSAPQRANVAVQHRGWWYYVDDADLASKKTFLQIQILFLTRLCRGDARDADHASFDDSGQVTALNELFRSALRVDRPSRRCKRPSDFS